VNNSWHGYCKTYLQLLAANFPSANSNKPSMESPPDILPIQIIHGFVFYTNINPLRYLLYQRKIRSRNFQAHLTIMQARGNRRLILLRRLTLGLINFDCEKTDETQTSRVTSYLSTNLLVSVLTCFITIEQIDETESL